MPLKIRASIEKEEKKKIKSARRRRARAQSFAKKKKREKRQHATLCLGVAAKERKTNNKQQNASSLTGVRDRRLSHLKITRRTLAVVLFRSRDDASNNAKVVVVFYRAAKTMMTRLHATHNWGKKSRIFLIFYRAIHARTKREEEEVKEEEEHR